MDAEEQKSVNIGGTRHAVAFAEAVGAGCFHHVSSIAAAGMYEGVFREDMFEEAEELGHPYFSTKHESEKVVREDLVKRGMTIVSDVDLAAFRAAGDKAYEALGLTEQKNAVLKEIGKQ